MNKKLNKIFPFQENFNTAFFKAGEGFFKVLYKRDAQFLIEEIAFLPPQKSFSPTSLNPFLKDLQEALTKAQEGKPFDFNLDFLNFLKLPSTYQKILKTLALTKVGDTLSYQELAIKSGFTKNHARVCGSAMAKNPFPLIIPCHRVLPVNKKIGNYSGGEGSITKKKLLEKEQTYINFIRNKKTM